RLRFTAYRTGLPAHYTGMPSGLLRPHHRVAHLRLGRRLDDATSNASPIGLLAARPAAIACVGPTVEHGAAHRASQPEGCHSDMVTDSRNARQPPVTSNYQRVQNVYANMANLLTVWQICVYPPKRAGGQTVCYLCIQLATGGAIASLGVEEI